MRIPSATLSMIATAYLALGAGAARADTVVQIALPGLLDGRSVTTLTGGNLVVWTVPTDGGGLQNAFATVAVAKLKGTPTANALPDDGRFPANARHPEVVLHFSNDADAASPQTHLVKPGTSVTFAVPGATYSKLFLFFNGAAGGTSVKVTLTYADATEIQNASVPDYYADVSPNDAVIFNLATDLAKWSKATTIAEAGHHNITGVELRPMASKTLTAVQVDRGPNGTLLFWGATGIATSAVAGLPDGGADASVADGGDARPTGAGGGGGASGGAAGTGAAGATGGGGAAAGATGSTAGTGGGSPAGAGGAAGGTVTAGGAGASGAAGSSAGGGAGCGCRLGAGTPRVPASWLALGLAVTWGLRRRAPRRRAAPVGPPAWPALCSGKARHIDAGDE